MNDVVFKREELQSIPNLPRYMFIILSCAKKITINEIIIEEGSDCHKKLNLIRDGKKLPPEKEMPKNKKLAEMRSKIRSKTKCCGH
jgi:hypothetical protein